MRAKLPSGDSHMAEQRIQRLKASPPLFENRFLDFFSRIHPVIPAAIYVPAVLGAVWLGARDGLSALALAALVLAGLAIWTLLEYWLHRKLFHWEPDNAIGRRVHFIIHGIHHEHPNDPLRLVMPPAASLPLAGLFLALFVLVFGTPHALPIFAGLLIGYLGYDYTHYYLHHMVPRTTLGRKLREHHMRHHFQDHRYGFGVSTPIWDYVFRTHPRYRPAGEGKRVWRAADAVESSAREPAPSRQD